MTPEQERRSMAWVYFASGALAGLSGSNIEAVYRATLGSADRQEPGEAFAEIATTLAARIADHLLVEFNLRFEKDDGRSQS